jgi:hypothetical protein
VFNSGAFSAYACHFHNNMVELADVVCRSTGEDGCTSSGGAICSNGGVLFIRNCTFLGNEVRHSTTSKRLKQRATGLGGAISVFGGGSSGESGSVHTIMDCTFAGNVVAVADYTTLMHNYATQKAQGGALYSTQTSIGNLSGCRFVDNNATATGPFPQAFGGAVASFRDLKGGLLINCTFQSNFVTSTSTQQEEGISQAQGGGMYRYCSSSSASEGSGSAASTDISLVNVSFEDNTASMGGGVFLEACNSTILGPAFKHNFARIGGTDIYAPSG